VALRLLSRWAIPFFFIVSGYFLARKYSKTETLNVLPTVERLIWVFMLWIALYAPFMVYNHDLTTLFKLIAAPAFIFFGLFTHLWFLPSLLFGYLFVSFCQHYNVKPLLPIMSIVCVGMALISGAYKIFDVGFPLDYETARTWLSIPFLYIGFLLNARRPSWQFSVCLILCGAGLQFFEAKYLYAQFKLSAYEHQFLVGTIPFAIGMAALALNDIKILQHPILGKWGNAYALGVYLIHPAAIFLCAPVIARMTFGLAKFAAWQLAYPLVILFVCLALLSSIRRFLPFVFDVLFGTHIKT
jgi:surface polysaccharide O-acyltransferase-like enzyme